MPLVQLVIMLVIVGVVLYLVNNLIPMDPTIKTIINVLVVIVVCLWLLSLIGFGGTTGPYIGPRRY